MDINLLKYQEIDKKINEAKNGSVDLKLQQNLQNAIAETKKWQANILELEQLAKRLLEEYNKLMTVEQKGLAFVDKYEKMDTEKMTTEELEDYALKTKQTASQMEELAKRVEEHNSNVKTVVQNYKNARKNWIECKTKRDKLREEYESLSNKSLPEVETLKKELAKLEKAIEPSILAKYKSAKQDGVFPVLIPLHENRCGGCRMQLSTSAVEKLKADGIYECEQCRRLIYFDVK